MTETQERLLNLLNKVDSVCKKHHITYYCEGGTALGAVRNHGFLPWDDDLDICMKRSEFEKLLAVCDDFREMDLDMVCHARYPEYHKSTIKVTDLTTSCIYTSHELHGLACGQHIDIFILDPVPSEKDEEFLAYYTVYAELLSDYYVVNPAIKNYKELYYKYLNMSKEIGRQEVLRQLEEKIFSYPDEEADHYFFRWGDKQFFLDKKLFDGEPVYVQFENGMYPIAPYPAGFLRGEFGESWKIIPERKERQTHNVYVNYGVSSNNVHQDFMRFIEAKKVRKAFQGRKPVWIERLPYEDEYKKEEARIKAMVLVEKLLRPLKEKGDYRRLIEQKRFAEARKLFGRYWALQGVFGKTGVLPEIDDQMFYEILTLQTLTGEYYDAEYILDVLKQQRRLDGQFQALENLIAKSRALVTAMDDGRWDDAEQVLSENPQLCGCHIDFLCADVTLKLRNPDFIPDEAVIKQVKEGLKSFSDSGDLMKLYGDLLSRLGEEKEAYTLYQKASEHTRNGLTLLALREEHGIDPIAKEYAEA